MTDMLKKEIGYIIFLYPTTSFYIKTSFNPALCPVKPGYFFDIDTGRLVPKSLVEHLEKTVQREEPLHLKQQSDFWRFLMREFGSELNRVTKMAKSNLDLLPNVKHPEFFLTDAIPFSKTISERLGGFR